MVSASYKFNGSDASRPSTGIREQMGEFNWGGGGVEPCFNGVVYFQPQLGGGNTKRSLRGSRLFVKGGGVEVLGWGFHIG